MADFHRRNRCCLALAESSRELMGLTLEGHRHQSATGLGVDDDGRPAAFDGLEVEQGKTLFPFQVGKERGDFISRRNASRDTGEIFRCFGLYLVNKPA